MLGTYNDPPFPRNPRAVTERRAASKVAQIVAPHPRADFRVGQAGSLVRDTPEGRRVIDVILLDFVAWCWTHGIPWSTWTVE